MSREMSLDEIGLLTRRPVPVFSKVLALVIRGVIGAPKSALRAFFLPRVKFIFNENHCKFIAICSISVLDTSEGNKHVIQHPVWSVSALYMLFLSVKASHALFFTIHSAERAFLVGRQSHPW